MAKGNNAAMKDLLNDFAKLSAGPVQWPKPGDTVGKLLLPPGRELRNFYEPFFATMKNGDQVRYFLVPFVFLEADDETVACDPTEVRYFKLPKGVMDGIIKALGKKWDLFGVKGPKVVITQNKGTKVSYDFSVLPPSDDDNVFDASNVTWPEVSIEQAAREQSRIGLDAPKATAKAQSDEEDLL